MQNENVIEQIVDFFQINIDKTILFTRHQKHAFNLTKWKTNLF
jgi:hypothetical protein